MSDIDGSSIPIGAAGSVSDPPRCRILLVDDRAPNLLALEAVLETLGHELVSASSGPDALAHLAKGGFALILLDVQMPGMDGFETAREARRLAESAGETVPIVFLSAIDTDGARIASMYAHGAVDFLQKPFDPTVLRAKVDVFVELYRAKQRLVCERVLAQARLRALTELGAGLAHAQKRSDVVDVIIEHGMRLARADTCTLYAIDAAGTTLDLLGERGVAHAVVDRIRQITDRGGNPELFASVRGGTTLWAETAAEYERMFPTVARLPASERRAKAFWSAPLVVDGRAIGLLGMGFFEPRRFSSEERSLVGAFTKQCAQALQRARLLEREDETRQWLTTTLRSIGDAVIATDTEGHVTFMNPIAERLTGWDESDARGRRLPEIFAIFSEATRAPVENPVSRVLREGTVVGLANHTFLRSRGGVEIPIDDSAAPIRDERGKLLGVVLTFRDVTEEKRESVRREFLATAGEALVASLDYRETLATVTRLAVPQLADWCAIDLLEPGAPAPEQLAVAHVDPNKIAFAHELRERYPPDPEAPTGVPAVIRSGRAELYPHIPAELLEAGAQDAEHLRIIRELKLESAMVVPLQGRQRTLGAMTFIYADSGRRYAQADLAFAAEFARRAALAIENARAVKDTEDARAAETFAVEAARLFSATLDLDVTIERIAQLAVPRFADWCTVDLLSDGGEAFDRVGVGHHRPDGAEVSAAMKRRYALRRDTPTGVARAIADRKSELGRDLGDEFCRAVATDDAHLHALRSLAARSFVVAPLVVRGESIGAITFLACERNFHERDLWLVEQLAASASAAIDNARLFRAEQRGRHRIGRMQEITAALSRARSGTDVAEAVCETGAKAVDALSGALWLLREDGALQLAGSWGPSRALLEAFRVIPPDAEGVPALKVVETRAPIWIETAEDYERCAPEIFANAKAANNVVAYSAVPLFLGAAVAGVLVFTHESGHRYDEHERSFHLTLALHCSRALERARLLDAERDANERLRLLAAAGEALARSLDIEESLRAVAELTVPAFCDWCVIDLVEGEEIRRVATVHSNRDRAREAQDAAAQNPRRVDDADGIARVIAEGKVRFFARVPSEVITRVARSARSLARMQEFPIVSTIALPVVVSNTCIGALSFATAESGRVYDEDDLRFASDIGRRVELAISNARLYRASREALERAERETRKAEEQRRHAEDASRLKDEFLATVSHELRTPLNAINGWSVLLASKLDDRASVAKGVEVIRRNAQAQTKIIEDILDVSRIVTGKLKIEAVPIDVIRCVREAMEVLRPTADARQVALELRTPREGPLLLFADAPRLQQVVWNLLSNAIKFSNPGGHVTVGIDDDDTNVCVTVTDDGRGIEPAFLPYVFDRFTQADSSTTRKYGGLGLGLAIVRHIVELHGGRVAAQSPGPDQGATFTVTLPTRGDARPPAPEDRPTPRSIHPSASPSGTLDGLRVLVVDNEPDTLELVATVLQEAGAVVEPVGSAHDAMEALDRLRPDVLVSDVGMPGEDGYALIRTIRARPAQEGRDVSAIAFTAYARAEDRERALAAGFDDHLTKPVDPTKLIAAVSRARRP
jgi:PAS domain S-box-containing protein